MIQSQAITALLGCAVCLYGALAGRNNYGIRVWMLLSGILGLWSFLLWAYGNPNPHVTNIWVMSNVMVLAPVVMDYAHESLKPIQCVLISGIAFVCLHYFVHNGIFGYAPLPMAISSLGIAAVAGLSCAGNRRCNMILVTLCAASLVDAALYSFSLEWFRFNPPHLLRSIRNIIWLAAHVSMAYLVSRR